MIIGKNVSGNLLKRVLDYSFTVIILFLLIPVILILVIAIKISGNGPVLYTQKRIGLYGKPFTLYKFRSMHSGSEEPGPLISGKKDLRITRMGRFMRKHKLDEIPNFINVLKGDMSLVGPRPEQQHYIDQIIIRAPEYSKLKDVRPGITSWGQVKYGYASNVDQMIERLRYDIEYIERRSLLFDFKIAILSVGIIFRGEGV